MSSSNPRNDQALLDQLCIERDCDGPSWWECDARGCYQHAKSAYADGARKADQINGPQGRYQDERSTDGRNIYDDMRGRYKPRPKLL